jgi:hypothetical protein
MLHFNWNDYGLCGLPTLSLDDYTFQALGLDDLFHQVLEKIKTSEEKNVRIRWRLIGYWGIGKSTFIYNLCYRINDAFFFGDYLENQIVKNYKHILALYINTPRRKSELLENIFENGLPIPWTQSEEKIEVERKRIFLLKKCIRKLAFLYLRKALNETLTKGYVFKELSMSKQIDVVSQLSKFDNLLTNDFIIQTDLLAKIKKVQYHDLERLLREYLKLKYPEYQVIYESLAAAVHPIESSLYLEAFRKLSDRFTQGLQNIDIFRLVFKNADVSVLLSIDEAEDWTTIVKYKLDHELLSILNSLDLSVILVFRTEVMRRIRRQSVLYRYLGIIQHLEDMIIPELKIPQILEITKGCLSTARSNDEWSLHPFSEEFIKLIASKTKRGGKFNIRIYLRTLSDILQKSLSWKRDTPLLDGKIFNMFDVKSVINEAIIHEISKERGSTALDIEKVHRFEVASLIAQRLLIMQDPPHTRKQLEALKAQYARTLNSKIPSDLEIVASVEDKHQKEKLIRLIENARMY